ncbi:MAG: hypothetical protein ACK5Z5_00985 [Neisseriaceae bacterium]
MNASFTSAPTRKVMRNQLHQEVSNSGLWCKGISVHRENLEKIAQEILEIDDSEYQWLPPNISMVYKNEFLFILQDYKYFNAEKFAKLDDYCLMEDILFSLNLPKYESDTHYFHTNRYIEYQPANYSSSDVGDSDDEFDNNTGLTKFTLERPLNACDTSIWCQDGPIKGDMLIYNCQSIIFSQLNECHGYWEDGSSGEDSNGDEYHSYSIANDGAILRNLGNYMYEQSACSEKAPLQEELGDTEVINKITSPEHNITFQLIQLGYTTRLINPEFNLLDFTLESNIEKGLTYREINMINQQVISYLSRALPNEIINQILAGLQLARLKDNEHQTNEFNNLLNNYGLDNNNCHNLIVWIDYLNTLIFKVEASRINTTAITGIMMLQLIEYGHLTYEEAFYDNGNFLGQFPGASIATKHNFKARAQLLTYKGFLGMKTDRQHPKWLMCTLKESIMMMNWLKIFVLKGDDPKFVTRDELLKNFTTDVHVMMQTYLRVAFEM